MATFFGALAASWYTLNVPARALIPVLSTSLAVFACAGGQAEHSSERERASDERQARSSSETSSTESETPTPRAPAGPPPVLAVRAERTRDRTFAPVVQNRGRELARISSRLVLEREGEDAFEAVPSVDLSLRWDCATAAPECVELAPGAELRPPAWLGTLGDAQCDCERCADAPAGTYRFVVTTCDGDHRIVGDAFTR